MKNPSNNNFRKRKAISRSLLLMIAAAISLPGATANDLQSDEQTVASPIAGMIRVGGTPRMVNVGDMLTHAELAALQQVANAGRQSLILGSAGTAVGGTVVLNGMTPNAAFVIPRGVTALADFSARNVLPLNVDVTNYGNLFALTTARLNQNGTLFADNIRNHQGGVISSIIPKELVPGAVNEHFDLGLHAANAIHNSGVISSSGKLSLFSGSGNITNSGLISAGGDLHFTTAPGGSLTIQGSGGVIESLAGTINLRAEQGAVNANLGTINGLVNLKARDAHLFAMTDNLQIGTMDLSGDPTFYNASGSVTMNNFVSTPGQPLAIVASQDIVITGGSISTSGTTAGDILIIAGIKFDDPGIGNQLVLHDPSLSLGLGHTGGAIRITGITAITAKGSGGSGGDVTILAYGGTGNGSTLAPGSIIVPNIETGGHGDTAYGGNVLIVGSQAIGVAIQTGDVVTAGTGGASPGSITIHVAQPNIGTLRINPDGSLANVANITLGLRNSGGVTTGTLNSSGSGGSPGSNLNGTNAAPITVTAGGDIITKNIFAFGGGGAGTVLASNQGFQKSGNGGRGANIEISSGHQFGSVFAGGGLVFINGYISTSGGGGGGGNGAAANTGGDGGDAGTIKVYARDFIEFYEDIYAVGGGGGGNGGNGGHGASIDIRSFSDSIAMGMINNSGGGGGSAFAGATVGGAGGMAGATMSVRAWTGLRAGTILSAPGGTGRGGGGGSFGGGGGGGGNSPHAGGGVGSGGNGSLTGGYGGGGSYGGGGGGGGLLNLGTGGGGAGITGGGGAGTTEGGRGGGAIFGGSGGVSGAGAGTQGGSNGVSAPTGGVGGIGGQFRFSGPDGRPAEYQNKIVSGGGGGAMGSGAVARGGSIGGNYTGSGGAGLGTYGDGGDGGAFTDGDGVSHVDFTGAGQITFWGNHLVGNGGYIKLDGHILDGFSNPPAPGAYNSSSHKSTGMYGYMERIVPSASVEIMGAGTGMPLPIKVTIDPTCCSSAKGVEPMTFQRHNNPNPNPNPHPGGGNSNNNTPDTPPGLEVAEQHRPPTTPSLPEVIIATNPSVTILPTDVTGIEITPAPQTPATDTTPPSNNSNGETVEILTPGLGSTAIEKGWVLVSPQDNTTIKTPMGEVHIAADAVVLLHVTNNRTTVYVMSDVNDGDVTVTAGGKTIALSVGQQVTIDKKDATIGEGTPPPGQIALRNARSEDLDGDLVATISDFSMPGALSNGNLYNTLAKTDKPLLDKLMKSAASVHAATAHRGRYK